MTNQSNSWLDKNPFTIDNDTDKLTNPIPSSTAYAYSDEFEPIPEPVFHKQDDDIDPRAYRFGYWLAMIFLGIASITAVLFTAGCGILVVIAIFGMI